jgi:phenylacetate-CoA ligase
MIGATLLAPREIARWLATAGRLARHPRVSREALLRFQTRRLQRLIRHVGTAVPFYRDLYANHGVEVSSVRDATDLDRLPVVTKEALRAAPLGAVLASGADADALVVHRTSGSTGRPFAIRRTLAEERLLRLFRLRAVRQFGARARDRTVFVGEPSLDPRQTHLGRLRRGLGVQRVETISCFQPVEAIAEQLDRAAPSVVCGYPGTLAHVATRLAALPLPGVRPKLVYTGGEPLHAHYRRRIRTGFGARVFDAYGAHEFDLLAWECLETGLLHVCEDNVIVEVLRNGSPVREGEIGEVVATGLHSFTMPFVRYVTRDIATRGPVPCPCGQPFSTLRAVQGRTPHYVRLRDGRLVHPFELTGPLIVEHGEWIEQHQLIQLSPEEVVLRIAPLGTPPAGSLERLHELGRKLLGASVAFRVELVAALRPGPSGKFEPYVSHLPFGPETPAASEAPVEDAT